MLARVLDLISALWHATLLVGILSVVFAAARALAGLVELCNLVVITRVASFAGVDILWVAVAPAVLVALGAVVVANLRGVSSEPV